MLYEFLKWLSNDYTMLNVFNYLSLRAVLSVITALTISFIFGGWYIKKLGDYSVGQYVRANGPTTHIEKMGTPTMGVLSLITKSASNSSKITPASCSFLNAS